MQFLTDLNFLQPGQIFPPRSDVERLTDYNDNIKLYEGTTYDIFKYYFHDATRRLEKILNDVAERVYHCTDINYHRLTTNAITDLVCGEPPIISADGANGDTLTELRTDTEFDSRLTECVIDLSRLGDTAARVYKDADAKPALQVVQPGQLFKIVDKEDKNRVVNYVLAVPRETPRSTEQKPEWELLVQIHYKGYYIYRVYDLLGRKVESKFIVKETQRQITNLKLYEIRQQKLLPSGGFEKKVQTGLSDFAIVSAHNMITSNTCYGHSDYTDMDPILAEIWTRLGQIAIILDKHSRPDMHAPISSFTQDDRTGQWKLKTGEGKGYIVREGELPPGYITWDGQLGACFNELDRLFDQLYKVTEMGPIYEAAKSGANIAYETMKATFTRPLAKAARMTKALTLPVKKILSLLSELAGKKIEPTEISIEWQDGLPNDEKQEIEKAKLKCDAGLSTPKRENIARFGKDEAQAEEIDEEARTYQSERSASSFGGYGGGDYGDG